MRHITLMATCAGLLIGSASLQAAELPRTGQDNVLEWQVMANWKIEGQPIDISHSLDGKLVFILNSEQKVLVYNNRGELQGRLPVGEGVTSIDIAPQGELLYLIDKDAMSFTAVQLGFLQSIDVTGSPFQGKADAPVTIAVFTDFE